MLSCKRYFGIRDSQLEGIGVDGQYIHLDGQYILVKLMEVNYVSSAEELDKWVAAVRELSHNINLPDHDIHKIQIFYWLVRITNTLGSISSSINIGKGLEQVH